MDEWGGPATWAMLIPIVTIVGAFTVAIVATIMKSRVRELEIRERIAMIEKGLVPPPEVDPRGFERALQRTSALQQGVGSARHRRAGITLMGVGFGLMVLISFAGDTPSAGVGVGGFLVVLGLAFFINSLFETRQVSTVPPRPPSAVTPAPRQE